MTHLLSLRGRMGMNTWYKGLGKLFGVILLVATLLQSGVGWGQETESVPPPTQMQEKEPVPEEGPEKPVEKPPELPVSILKVHPDAQPQTTLEIGPLTGVLAPYSYAAALDTLSRGWEYHRLGPVRVSPYLGILEVYRTNIYQTSTDKITDLVNNVNPGLRFELPLAQRHRLSLGYLGNYYFFSRYGQNDHLDHNINLDGTFNFPGGLALRAGNTFRAATEERNAVTGRQRPYKRISPYFQGAYKMADLWKLEANYQNDNLLFNDTVDRQSDYSDQTAGMVLYYKFLPKTSALVQYIFTYRNHPYNNTSDNIIQTPLIGLSWDATAKLSGTIKFGYSIQDYLQDMPQRANHSASPSFSVQTVFRASNYTNITIIGQRSVQEDPDSNNNAYYNTGFYISLNHKWHYFNVESYVIFSFYNNLYKSITPEPVTGTLNRRDDNIYAAGCGIMRPLTKYLQLRIDYVYYDRGSNFPTYTYNEHKVIFGIQASY
jgi:hypothetical protein